MRRTPHDDSLFSSERNARERQIEKGGSFRNVFDSYTLIVRATSDFILASLAESQ